MPIINIQLLEGRTVDQKRALAKALTEATSASLGCKPEAVDVIIQDVKREDWARGGKLWLDVTS